MKSIRKQLEKELNETVEDIRYYDVRGLSAKVREFEFQADSIKEQLDILSLIEREREGNLLHFNGDGTFALWCIRIPEGGEQIVEHYNCTFTFEEYEELLETSDCIDVTGIFDISAITTNIIVTDDISKCDRRDVYYFVSNEAMEEAAITNLVPVTEQNQYEKLFDEYLELTEFTLIKCKSDSNKEAFWRVKDRQGGNFGDIENDVFNSAEMILDRMDIYINDYIIEALEAIADESEIELPEHNCWSDILKYRHLFPDDSQNDLDMLDMICNHPKEINLENCCYEEEQ